jgi:hypothetical protein
LVVNFNSVGISVKKTRAKIMVKVKYSWPYTSHKATEGGVKLNLHSFLNLALNGSEWLVGNYPWIP